jgi:predicted phage baseplate assembly protein
MSVGRDIRTKDLVMVPAPVDGGLEPQLLPPARQTVRSQVAARIPAYTPEWTSRRADDAGRALVRTYGTVAEAVNVRVNRVPRKLTLDHLAIAGVRTLQARPAEATLGIEVAQRGNAPIEVPAGSAFLAPGGAVPVVLETLQACVAMPGELASVAVLSDGWIVNDQPSGLGGVAPFGPHPTVPAELWLGIDSPVAPTGLLSLAVEFVAAASREAASADATVPPAAPPTLRWEAMTTAGPAELPVERDDTAGLSQTGVLALRVDTRATWAARTLPGRPEDPPLYWVRARLVTADYPPALRLARITLNGVTAIAARSVRGEVLEPIERPVTGRASYRLSQIPVVPGSVFIDVADASADPFGEEAAADVTSAWTETDDLASLEPEDRRFLLDAATGIVTFGDGFHGRAVPDGFRNVVARVYSAGGGTAGLPAPGDTVSPQRSVPNLTGAAVLTITTGADTESAGELVLRGPAQLCSRGRAVAPGDYATMALGTKGVDVARAHCLPGRDPRSSGVPVPGVVGLIVVPDTAAAGGRPLPSPEALRLVADHLAREVGVLGAEVIAAAPTYREITAQAALVARAGSDLAAVGSAARDAIDAWLDPLHGAGGTGWPFGGAVAWDALTRLLLAEVPALTAVARLALRIDGRRLPACTDAVIRPGELVWPGSHLIEVVAEGRAS